MGHRGWLALLLTLGMAALAATAFGHLAGLDALGPWLAAVAFGVAVLARELLRLARGPDGPGRATARGGEEPPQPVDRASRRRVRTGIREMTGVEKVPNLRDPRFHRFVGLPEGGRSTRDAPINRGATRALPRLEGELTLVSIFVGADGRRWSDSEVAVQLEGLDRAGRWIMAEAGRWGRGVAVGLADTYFDVLDRDDEPVAIGPTLLAGEVDLMEAEAEARALRMMSRAALGLGFRDAVELVERAGAAFRDTLPVWLLFVRRAGRSIAIGPDRSELDGVSLALCYARPANFSEPIVRVRRADPATVVHEVLHLFGARDKYGPPLSAFAPGTVTGRDVMRLDREDLDGLRVDLATARELGWA